jgi:Flp pilus assembly protein TadD
MRRFQTLTLFLFLALITAQFAVGQDLAAQERAEGLIEEARYSEAIVLLNSIITPNTADTRPLLLRAAAHEGRRDNMSAARDYERVIQLNPGSQEAIDGLRRTRQVQFNDTNAGNNARGSANMESLGRLVNLNPDNLAYRIRYADALSDAKRFREAAVQYGEYLDRTQGTPDVVQAYLITIAAYEGDNALGERVAEKYTQIYSTNDDLWMRLGYFRIWQGKQKEAQAACEQALLLNPNNQEAKDCLGASREPAAGGNRTVSQYPIDVLFRELKSEPQNDIKRFQLADLLTEARRYFEAKQQLDILAPRHRGSEDWNRRYTLIENRIQTEPAPRNAGNLFIIDRLIAELKRDPSNAEKRFQLIEQFIKYGRFYEAYDNLVLLEPEYGQSQKWTGFFVQADEGLIKTQGQSPIYPVDRHTYRLRYNPNDIITRYALVDALVAVDRYAEAYDVLTDPAYARPMDPGYSARIQAMNETRLNRALVRIAEMESAVASNPNDESAWRELIGLYKIVDRPDDVIRAYVRVIELRPEDREIRIEYVDALRVNGYPEKAVSQAGWLADRDPNNAVIQRLYVMSQFAMDQLDTRGESFLSGLLANRNTKDAELLIETSAYRLRRSDLDSATIYLDRAEVLNMPQFATQIDAMKHLIARETLRVEQEEQFSVLNEARRLVSAKRFDDAITEYERYFEIRGKRTRDELKELAGVYAAKKDYQESVSIYQSLLSELYEYDVAKEMSRVQVYREDYSGALATLERLQRENPRDYEVRFMQAESLRALGLFAQARIIYDEALVLAEDSDYIKSRQVGIDSDIRAKLVESGKWTGNDYAGIVVPTADATRSRGGGTRYDRWAQGMQTQVTLPINAVLSAGVNSHFISGSRRLVPGSEIVRGRVNQVFGGVYVDLTPPIRSDKASYTNRISGELGVYDYEGARTVMYGGVRYWRQEEGKYLGSMGIRTGEGTIDLWAAGGGQFNLRLSQFDIQGSSVTIMPDSVLKVNGYLALNVVRDNFGNTASSTDTNFGNNMRLEAAYRIVDYTYLGLTYYQTAYRSTVDTYFSPRNYQSYDFFLEYERELPQNWYVRIRGAVGIIARSSGFVGRRFEADYIKRLGSNFSMTLRTTMGSSTRTLGSGATSFIDRYNTFTFGGALYWTL